MRVVFLTQYYPPETGAAPNRLWNLAQRLAGQGHSVSVMTALPSYPRGTIFEEYRGRILLPARRLPQPPYPSSQWSSDPLSAA